MIITISGPPGSGTTTLARALSATLGLRWINSGDQFRKIAADKGISLRELGKIAEKGPDVDYLIDDAQRAMAKDGGGIFEGRLSGHLLDANIKIALKADIKIRGERIGKRENKLAEDAIAEARLREESEARRYEKYYNIDIRDLSYFDLVIDTGRLNEQGTFSIVMAAVKSIQR
jgi:cytidylate kinase